MDRQSFMWRPIIYVTLRILISDKKFEKRLPYDTKFWREKTSAKQFIPDNILVNAWNSKVPEIIITVCQSIEYQSTSVVHG